MLLSADGRLGSEQVSSGEWKSLLFNLCMTSIPATEASLFMSLLSTNGVAGERG